MWKETSDILLHLKWALSGRGIGVKRGKPTTPLRDVHRDVWRRLTKDGEVATVVRLTHGQHRFRGCDEDGDWRLPLSKFDIFGMIMDTGSRLTSLVMPRDSKSVDWPAISSAS